MLGHGDDSNALINDFPAGMPLNFFSIVNRGYEIRGNPIQLADGITSWPLELGKTDDPNRFYLDITLTAAQDFAAFGNDLLLHGNVDTGEYMLTLRAMDDLEIHGVISGLGSIRKTHPGGVFLWGDNTYSGGTTVLEGWLSLERSPDGGGAGSTGTGSVYVAPGAQIRGYGSVGGPLTVDGVIAPGGDAQSHGRLSTADIVLNGGAAFDVSSPESSGCDGLDVAGTVTINPGCTLETFFDLVSAPQTGTVFTIIDNDGSEGIAGTFSGLPEGAIHYSGSLRLRVSYVGGDGNDVTLTIAPATWDGGGADSHWGTPGNWDGDRIPHPSLDLIFDSALSSFAVNDNSEFPYVQSLSFRTPFTLNGNPIWIMSGITAYERLVLGTGLELLDDQAFIQHQGLMTVWGNIELGGRSLSLAGDGDFEINGVVSGAGWLNKSGAGSVVLGGVNTYTGGTTISNGSLVLRHDADAGGMVSTGTGAVTILRGGSLLGNGRTGAVWSEGLIRPTRTAGAGVLSTGHLVTSGMLEFCLWGHAASGAGFAYDRLVVEGTVTLAANAVLSLQFSDVDSHGGVYTLIDNDGTDAISGTFVGAPEGHVFVHKRPFGDGNEYYRLSYAGGDGNDMTLTRIAPTTIAGIVFRDADRDGTFNSAAGDMTLAGMGVFIDTDGDRLVDEGERSVLTDDDGAYAFEELAEGAHHVRVMPPSGWRLTTAAGQLVSVTLWEISSGNDFGLSDTSAIRGSVFHDVNGDGVLDVGEPALVNRRVFLDANNNAVFDAGEVNRRTGADGRYTFEGLAAGVYRVRAAVPEGWRSSGGASSVISLAAGSSVGARTLLQTQRAAVVGVGFHDVDGDGRRDAGEGALVGYRVFVDANGDGMFNEGERSVLSDEAGNWAFRDLTPGTYVIRMGKPRGWGYTTPVGGVYRFTLRRGQVAPKAVFGVRKIA